MERTRVETGLRYKVYGRLPRTELVTLQGLTREGDFIEIGGAKDIKRLKIVMAKTEKDFIPLITTEGITCPKGMTELYVLVEDLPHWW